MTTLNLVLKNIESKHNKNNVPYFIRTKKQKQLLMKVILMMCLNQSIQQLYQTCKLKKK